MRGYTAVFIGLAWVASLAGAVAWAQGGGGSAQQLRAVGPVISGENIGFQAIADPWAPKGRIPGKLVVKIDGEWRDVHLSAFVTR